MLHRKIHLDSNGQDLAVEHIHASLDYRPETGEFFWRETLSNVAPAGRSAGSLGKRGYVSIQIGGKIYRANRLAWFYVYGEWPARDIDHINGITSDNRISNLRPATCSENQANAARRIDNTSGLKGVSYHKPTRKWSATLQHQGWRLHLGLFVAPELAAAAYADASRSLKGQFARLA